MPNYSYSTKITCAECGKEFGQMTSTHLKTHGMTFSDYQEKYPDAPLNAKDEDRRKDPERYQAMIPTWLAQCKEVYEKRMFIYDSFDKAFRDFVRNESKKLNIIPREFIVRVGLGIAETPRCKGGNNVSFFTDEWRYRTLCGDVSCVCQKEANRLGGEFCNKRLATQAERFENGHFMRDPVKRKEFDDQIERKYGARSVLSKKSTVRQKYDQDLAEAGYSNISQIPEINQKMRDTKRKQHDDPIIKKRIEDKRKETCLETFGTEFPIQNPDVFAKAQSNHYSRKKVVLPDGSTVSMLGFEPEVIKELLKKFDQSEIVFYPKAIKYELEGKIKTYFPDLYLPKFDLYIEVKSDYLWHIEAKKNHAKRRATIDQGHLHLVVMPRTKAWQEKMWRFFDRLNSQPSVGDDL